MTEIKCSAKCCDRTNISHPLNFRLRKKTGDPLCQAHYIQTKRVGFKEFHEVRDSGKEGTKYDKKKERKEKNYKCQFCNKNYCSANGLYYHYHYSPVGGESKCNIDYRKMICKKVSKKT